MVWYWHFTKDWLKYAFQIAFLLLMLNGNFKLDCWDFRMQQKLLSLVLILFGSNIDSAFNLVALWKVLFLKHCSWKELWSIPIACNRSIFSEIKPVRNKYRQKHYLTWFDGYHYWFDRVRYVIQFSHGKYSSLSVEK